MSAQVGLFIHNLTEEGQRRAFLDTRDCIAARLEMEDENEKLERLLLSVLPQHVAVEMKGDIMSPVEVGQTCTVGSTFSFSICYDGDDKEYQ